MPVHSGRQVRQDSRRLYRDWSDSYDTEFARTQDYRLPGLVADAFHAAGGQGKVLDVGAGTGLLAEHLGGLVVDGIDILVIDQGFMVLDSALGGSPKITTYDADGMLRGGWSGTVQLDFSHFALHRTGQSVSAWIEQ